jgi:anti-anti-sigma regulatory factor
MDTKVNSLLGQVRPFFAAPVFEGDEEKTRVASLLNAILLGLFPILIGFGVYYALALMGEPGLLYGLVEIAVAGVLALWFPWFLMRRGRVREASLLFTSLFWAFAVYFAFESGGVRSYDYSSLVLIPVVASLLMGGRAIIAMGTLSILAGLGLVYVDVAELAVLSFDSAESGVLDLWVARSLDFVIVMLLLYISNRSLVSALENARRSNCELQATQASLEQRVVVEQEQRERIEHLMRSEQEQRQVLEKQQQLVQALSTPIIPVMERIIILPLIGSIDSMRAKDITRNLLAGIRAHQAQVVILDITGVPVVDSGVANHLNKAIQAAQLKGARTIVTGISDVVAEAIVDLGIDWSGIETLADLQTGLLTALHSLRG